MEGCLINQQAIRLSKKIASTWIELISNDRPQRKDRQKCLHCCTQILNAVCSVFTGQRGLKWRPLVTVLSFNPPTGGCWHLGDCYDSTDEPEMLTCRTVGNCKTMNLPTFLITKMKALKP